MNQQQVAKLVDKLAVIKKAQSNLEATASLYVTQLKKLGGGESDRWQARLVRVQGHDVWIPTHKQLRLYSKAGK
jgi:hypothetical protein